MLYFSHHQTVLKKLSLVLFLILIDLGLLPTSVLARDPFPDVPRTKYIVAPYSAADADPRTMLTAKGIRSAIISFSCVDITTSNDVLDKQKRSKYVYLNDLEIDSQQAAESKCAKIRSSNSGEYICGSYCYLYTEVLQPYLKNNKQTPECQGKTYDANCYDYPIGDFISDDPNSAAGNWAWVTPIVYSSSGGPLNACGSDRNQLCDCNYVPAGDKGDWVTITSGSRECVSPPYSLTYNNGHWWNSLVSQIKNIRNSYNGAAFNKLTAVAIYFGMDGEGRPFKAGDGWVNDTVSSSFYNSYVPAVINEVKQLYPGKTIRAHFVAGELDFFMENEINFHWESLDSDGVNEYLYKGLSPVGWDQLYANHFYFTNTLGLGVNWPPFYQSVLNALSKHTDGITGFVDLFDNGMYQDGKGDFIKFAGSYIGKDINDTPGVWTNLRETVNKKKAGGNVSGKYGDYTFYLYRAEDLDGNKTVPVRTDELPAGTANQIYNWKLPKRVWTYPDVNQYVGRKNAPGNNYMSFDIDDGYRYTKKTGVSFDVRVVYLDVGTDTFKFQYKDVNNQPKEHAITKTDTNLWQEAKFTLNDAYFNNNMSDYPYPTDFRFETNGTTLHLVEVIGKGDVTQQTRPKAQVSCALVKNEADDPKEGIYSVSLNQNIKVKARLVDNNGNPLPNERVMFTYNTEWNWAKSIKTNSSGVAFYDLSTANNVNRSGFLGDGGRGDLPSWYSIQVFYPGSDKYQPSRNDCMLPVYSSAGWSENDARMKIVSVDTSKVASTGKAIASYQILNSTNGVIAQGQKEVGKKEGFFADDSNAQTALLTWFANGTDYRYAFNNITLYGNNSGATPTPTPVCSNGDLGNLDCDSGSLIDESDLSLLLASWAPFGPVPTPVPGFHTADISPDGGDGKVDSGDLTVLLSNWRP